jgi:Lon protease-like protein
MEGEKEFGVALIKSGSEKEGAEVPFSVGTVARIIEMEKLSGGRMNLEVAGRSRFCIERMDMEEPYLRGSVVPIPETGATVLKPAILDEVKGAVTQYVRLLLGLVGEWVREAHTPQSPVALSYHVADLLKIELKEKQTLLQEPSTERRLEAELEILDREVTTLRQRVETAMQLKLYTGYGGPN